MSAFCSSDEFVSAGLAVVARSERRDALPMVCAVDVFSVGISRGGPQHRCRVRARHMEWRETALGPCGHGLANDSQITHTSEHTEGPTTKYGPDSSGSLMSRPGPDQGHVAYIAFTSVRSQGSVGCNTLNPGVDSRGTFGRALRRDHARGRWSAKICRCRCRVSVLGGRLIVCVSSVLPFEGEIGV